MMHTRRRHTASAASAVAIASVILFSLAGAQNLTFAPVPAPSPGATGSSLTNNPIPVPAGNGVYLGASLDWDWDQPNNISQRLGYPMLTYGIFLNFPLTFADVDFMNVTVRTKPFPIKSKDGSQAQIMLTLQPVEVTAIDDTTLNNQTVLDDVVTMVRQLNEAGVSVFVRFGHEMNGWWYAWGWRPMQYKKAFRKVAQAIKACPTCTKTAMLWAPQVATGFPWGLDVPYTNASWFLEHTDYARVNVTEVATLDSNGDGIISLGDEPYLPFYPGDDVVDWVGMSIYFTGINFYGENILPTPDTFIHAIRGLQPEFLNQQAPDFYGIYSVQKNKPFCLAETSANWNSRTAAANASAPTMLQMKQAWWQQTVSDSVFDRLPNYRASFLFEFIKLGEDVKTLSFDYGYTTTPEVAAAFHNDAPARVVWSDGTYSSINGRTNLVAGTGTQKTSATAATAAGSQATGAPGVAGSTKPGSAVAKNPASLAALVAATLIALVLAI
ncbi:glycoside hydrolase family 26 protein [Gonapodya prolifera JEL478]|uniref:Glycoside hydrolase family 26 protein n=1 Tax=Gonapodya prolifera (strain JEL478) TaxID=1344416 RepID=A0A139AY06_GONPJ|nr:glycoside hydrolase family 26 protein [Gonapodya prolifera JEL478]|eukprot:KXS21587.1 glycoside hydrolase family 26 protein [Gonapodya prolifera JEL478]